VTETFNVQKQTKSQSTVKYNDAQSQHLTAEPCMNVHTQSTLKHWNTHNCAH